VIGDDGNRPDWLGDAVVTDPSAARTLVGPRTTPLVVGGFRLWQDGNGFTFISMGQARGAPIEAEDAYLPGYAQDGVGVAWGEGVADGQKVERPVKAYSERRRQRAEELEDDHRDSAEWQDQMATLEEALQGRTARERIFAVGQEILAGDGEVTYRELADLAGLSDHTLVGGYLEILGEAAPGLFPDLVDDRGHELAAEFASSLEDWNARLAGLGRRRLGHVEYILVREVLAFRFRRELGVAPAATDLAGLTGWDADEAQRRFVEALKDEAERALATEFPRRESEWREGVAKLRRIKGLADARDFEIACRLVACVLGGLAVNDSRMAREIGIPPQTFTDNRKRIWVIVRGEFPALPGPRGRGGRG
jgi:hypothetical protein